MASSSTGTSDPPLVLHLIYRLAMGGLENGLVNVINHMPPHRYRHAIVSLTDCTDFQKRITRRDVEVVSIHKKEGLDWSSYLKVWKVLRQFRPTILHTRNLPTVEFALAAAMAGIPYRVHGEHGRDVHDQYGTSRKFQLFRKFLSLWIHQFITVSEDLSGWFVEKIGIGRHRIHQIYNGVDIGRFYPRHGDRSSHLPSELVPANLFLIGTVGRIQTVKDQETLVRAFLHLLHTTPSLSSRLRLILVGDGPLRQHIQHIIQEAGISDLVWMPGQREDIPEVLRSLDLFVLPSEAEGISNTILEAMASGLPVVATYVGGNPEIVVDGVTGYLVPPKDPIAMADALSAYANDSSLVQQHGRAGRDAAERRFSLDAMVKGYVDVYDGLVQPALQKA